MNDKVLAQLASFFKVSPETLKTVLDAQNETPLNDIMSTFKKENKIISVKDYETTLNNVVKTTLEELKPEQVPAKIKTQLVDEATSPLKLKIVELEKNGSGENVKTIEELRNTIKIKTEEFEKQLKEKDGVVGNKIINYEMNNAVKELKNKLEGDEKVVVNQIDLLLNAYKSKRKIEVADDKIIIRDDKNEIVKNQLVEPETLVNDMTAFAVNYGFKLKDSQQQGRGDNNSKTGGVLAGMTYDQWCIEANKKFPEFDEQRDAYYAEWRKANPET